MHLLRGLLTSPASAGGLNTETILIREEGCRKTEGGLGTLTTSVLGTLYPEAAEMNLKSTGAWGWLGRHPDDGAWSLDSCILAFPSLGQNKS